MEKQSELRGSVCCVLRDIGGAMENEVSVQNCRHYQLLASQINLTDQDWANAHSASVMHSLLLLTDLSYREKMLVGLVVCEMIIEQKNMLYSYHKLFELLMSAMDWDISFTEMMKVANRLE